jgi:hypothetical protein
MVTKLAVAFFPKSIKEMSEDDTPHDESGRLFELDKAETASKLYRRYHLPAETRQEIQHMTWKEDSSASSKKHIDRLQLVTATLSWGLIGKRAVSLSLPTLLKYYQARFELSKWFQRMYAREFENDTTYEKYCRVLEKRSKSRKKPPICEATEPHISRGNLISL